MPTNYERGRQYEYKSMRLLETAGYETVRTAGSHGPWDVAGFAAENIILVQVKFNCLPTPTDIETFRAYPVPRSVMKIFHIWEKGKGVPKVKPV